jgi:hypothetical protein
MQATLHAATTTVASMTQDLGAVTKALEAMPGAPATLSAEAKRLSGELRTLTTLLSGSRGFPPDPTIPRGVSQVVSQLFSQLDAYTGAPSDTQHAEAAEARERLSVAVDEANELREAMSELNGQLDAAGVPWTPGRAVRGSR